MGFFTGRVTYVRFQIDGPAPGMFGPEHLERLAAHVIGKQPAPDKDGVEVGWIAGDDILDTGFDLAKNVVNDALHFALRVDAHKLPGDLLRAYARADLQALAATNPSGLPSARQKREARDSARQRLEDEARDGRFVRRRASPLLWDGQANHLLVGSASPTVLDHVQQLFKDTFGANLIPLDAGRRALQLAAANSQTEVDVRPSTFVPNSELPAVAWVLSPDCPNHLGNELLLRLWYLSDTDGDTVALPDGSEVAILLARSLVLECPRGLSGRESIRSDAPTRLPEARRAVQAGKLPRQAGMILSRHDQQYEFTFQPEALAANGAKLPASEEGEERARLEERVTQLRHLIETIDLLYEAFLRFRLAPGWPEELARMQRWLHREERPRLAESA